MTELKTQVTDQDPTDFLNTIADEQRRGDCFALLDMMRAATGCEPKMWGSAMVGFGSRHYVYASGHQGVWFQIGFSPRKQNITLYLTCDIQQFGPLLEKLGRHKTGKGCLYIRRLTDVDESVLRELIRRALM